jgi:hypothetical protein
MYRDLAISETEFRDTVDDLNHLIPLMQEKCSRTACEMTMLRDFLSGLVGCLEKWRAGKDAERL